MVWVDLGCVVVFDVVWWCGCGVLICVGVGFGLVGLGRGGLWWHGGFGWGGAVMAWGRSCGWVPMGLGWILGGF